MVNKFDWIPWHRFVLTLLIDNNDESVFLGRFRFGKSARKEADRLSQYRGYIPKIIDTKVTSTKESVVSKIAQTS